jgi:alpha-ribazole phosphatase
VPLLLRHPPTAAAPGLCYGRHDPGLAPGWEAAIDALAAELPPLARVVTSPAARCRAPAERLAAALGLAAEAEPGLQELDFGAWEGRLWSEIPRAESDPWAESPRDRAPPEGESFAALDARVAAALAGIADGGGAALIVTHAGPIRATLMRARGESFETAFARPVPYATPIAV